MKELPEIELGDVQDSKLRKQIEKVLLFVGDVITENQDLRQRVALLEEENRRLKKQAKKPQQKDRSGIMPTQLLQEKSSEKKQWHKSSKRGLPVDRVVTVEEVAECTCGNTTFHSLRTKQKLVQGIRIIRDTVLYKGREKRCKACGRIYKPAFPQEAQGSSFSQELRSLVSFFKFYCRMSEPLIHRISYPH